MGHKLLPRPHFGELEHFRYVNEPYITHMRHSCRKQMQSQKGLHACI